LAVICYVSFFCLLAFCFSTLKQTCDSITTNCACAAALCVFKVPPILQNRSPALELVHVHPNVCICVCFCLWQCLWLRLPLWLFNMRVTLPAIKFKLHSLSTHCNMGQQQQQQQQWQRRHALKF